MRLRPQLDARSKRPGRALSSALVALTMALAAPRVAEAATSQVNLYDWMAPAPVVVVAGFRAKDEDRDAFEVLRVARGKVAEGSRLVVQSRAANRDRAPNTAALRFEEGRNYVLLLSPSAKQKKGEPTRFDLVRGVDGAREISTEGVAPFSDAVAVLAEIQAIQDDEKVWAAVSALLEESNPLLLRTALDLLLRYQRARPSDCERIRPLLDHPGADVREPAARLLGRVLTLPGSSDPAERAAMFAELAARARRDSSVDVRVAATESVATSGAAGVDDLLREIARDDPDQSVRYVAQRALYDRRTEDSPPPKAN